MMIAARESFAAARRKKGWTNPYITDGLVAMWDGEWNAGGGVHDPNASEWVDLSGNGHNFPIPSSMSFNAKCLVFNATAYIQTNMRFPVDMTIEMVYKQTNNSGTFVGNYESGATQFVHWDGMFRWKGAQISGVLNQVVRTLSRKCIRIKETATYADILNNKTFLRTNQPLSGGAITNTYVSVGRYNNGYTFTGEAYRINIYSRVLTNAELAANYAVDKERFNLP